MDFMLTDEQQAVQELAAQVTVPRKPGPGTRDDQLETPDWELWRQLAQAGLLGVGVPEALGGAGQDVVSVMLLVEACGRSLARVPVVPTLCGAIPALLEFGTKDQQTRWVGPVLRGELMLGVAVADATGGLRSPSLRAVPAGHETWSLEGLLPVVAFGQHSERVLVAAQSEAGIVHALIDPDSQGITRRDLATTSGLPAAALELSGVTVGPDAVVGRPSDGVNLRARIWTRMILGHCSTLVGIGAEALALSALYTSRREQFGRPLATFQAVAMHAADAYIDVHAARLTLLQAAWLVGVGRRADREVAIATWWAGEGIGRTVARAMHVHGGMGVLRDYPLHRYMLWAKEHELAMGAGEWQLERVAELLALP